MAATPQVPADLLQQLHPIHLPTALGIWPWAPGWYVLLGVGVLGLVLGLWWGWRLYCHGRAKRAALRLLDEYASAHSQVPDTQHTAAAIAELLKRVALVYFPRERVANLQGKDWLLFLNATGKNIDFLPEEEALLICPYQARSEHDLTTLFRLARLWIQQRSKACS
ncbi:MAG: DUF4381 domain-containing protein [Gammaproteobacteria bacterium]|nr:DUF4381 domain-containing protein [Gammaproteobacteria bacterium]